MDAQPQTPGAGPLKGLRAIELGSTVAGPFCARLLADFGADVIKLEQIDGDAVRYMGKRKAGRSLYAASILRGKRIVSLDLRMDQGQALARRFCETADILVENFKPGALERWGLGYDGLAEVNPGLILVRISGFGQDGPYARKPGYGVVCEAVSGLREITGDPDRPPPRVATSLTDYIAGLYGAFGAVMAVLDRHRTGRGQVVDTALYEGSFSFMEPHIPAFQQLGHVAQRAGPRLPDNTPNNLYPTRDGRHIQIVAITNSHFGRLLEVMGKSDLAGDACFSTPVARSQNADAVDAMIGDWTRTHDLADVERLLDASGLPSARIYTVADIFADPHFRHREMLVDVEDETLGPVTVPGVVPKLSANPGAVRWAGRGNGDDTRAVLAGELGLSDAEIETLARDGVIAGSGLPAVETAAGQGAAP